jgi:hypothetical protein
MKQIIITLCVIAGICSSCDGMLDNIQSYLDQGETIYVGKVDSLTALSGKNRIQLKGYYMYGVTQKKCIIRWQSQGEEDKSLELDVVRNNAIDPFDVIINDLDEGQYEFSVTTYDAKGNASIESVVEGYVYGDLYESNLTNRKLERAYMDDTGAVVLSWKPINNALKSEVYYTDITGRESMLEVPTADTETRITDCDTTQALRWRTVYLPEITAIDYFYSDFTETTVPLTHYSS